MMGETGPCGPCSELHVDLTPEGKTNGALVNQGSPSCIEIWNLVFIQFNANPDGTFSPLPARHVDTGMGFERVTSILQNTRGFTDLSRPVSNYETDIFRPIFDELEKLTGKTYGSTLPPAGSTGASEQEKIDVAFRVIADHIRTLSFAIADGILPGNNDRNYVLRRILRRAVRYGRTLGFREPFFFRLASVLAQTMGDVFPEIKSRLAVVQNTIRVEEETFTKTLDKGLEIFEEIIATSRAKGGELKTISGADAFLLSDTYGFPLDLTELMAREAGFAVDRHGFDVLMTQQKERARGAQVREVITLSSADAGLATSFIGFEQLQASAQVRDIVPIKDDLGVVLDISPCYAEMGGQVGDTGTLQHEGRTWRIVDTRKSGNAFVHVLAEKEAPGSGWPVTVAVDVPRREAIQRHHTVTHLLHWALHESVNPDAAQKGSFVGPEKLTFDFNGAALTPVQIRDIERLVNQRIVENSAVSWAEVPFSEVKPRKDIMQFFGDKYGERVRVVQIGGRAGALDGFSMELCGGTHTRATGEIGLFRIVAESAISAGVRRIEAVAGLRAYDRAREDADLLGTISARLNIPATELEKKLEALLAQQKEMEKLARATEQRQAAELAHRLMPKATSVGGILMIVENIGNGTGDYVQMVADALKSQFTGVVFLAGTAEGAVSLVATVAPSLTSSVQAGKLVQLAAPLVGGKGGGRPDNARGGGKDLARVEEALGQVRKTLGLL